MAWYKDPFDQFPNGFDIRIASAMRLPRHRARVQRSEPHVNDRVKAFSRASRLSNDGTNYLFYRYNLSADARSTRRVDGSDPVFHSDVSPWTRRVAHVLQSPRE